MNRIGEHHDFAAAWARVHVRVLGFISSSISDFHATEDIIQNVAIAAHRKHETFDPQQSTYLNWVLGIARHEIQLWRRSQKRDRMILSQDTIAQLAQTESAIQRDLSHEQIALRQCLDRLEKRSRKLIDMRYVDDLKPADIADRLGTSSGSVRVALHRIRQVLRDCMTRRLVAREPRS